MDYEAFENLEIGKEYYWHRRKFKLFGKEIDNDGDRWLRINWVPAEEKSIAFPIEWKAMHKDIGFAPLGEPKRFWRWKIGACTGWLKEQYYLDDNGVSTSGYQQYMTNAWNTYARVKIEDDWVEL